MSLEISSSPFIVQRLASQFCLRLVFLLTASTSLFADTVLINSGSLSITYDGAVFANRNSSSATGLVGSQDFMRYGRFWAPSETVRNAPNFLAKQPGDFRALPATTTTGTPRQPNFRDNRATLDPLYPQTSPTNVHPVNGRGSIPNSTGRNRIGTTFSFDPSNVTGTVSGLVQTNGVSSWWFANDAFMDQGFATLNWGDLSLRYDASRTGLGYSGWVIANQLGGIGDIFDTKNVLVSASNSGINLSGELWGSDGASADPYNENFATWESYTLMKPNLQIGSFSFIGSVTAVPEPTSLVLLSVAGIGAAFCARRKSKSKNGKTYHVS